MKELKAIARKIGVKNYESLSRIELVKEIDKLEPPKESKKKNITSSLLLKGKKILNLSLKKKIKPQKDVYKAKKIYSAFDDSYVEYQSNSDGDKSISIKRYLRIIRGYLKKITDSKKKNGEWKIELIMKINFISSRNFIESRDMYSKSDNIEIMMGVILMK